MDEFQPGEYTTRDGHEAIVEFRMREPTNAEFVLVGQVCLEGVWCRRLWALNGCAGLYCEHALDLMPPDDVTYRRLPCLRHDNYTPRRELGPANYAALMPKRNFCQDCQWERITRRDGKVIKLELLPQENHDEA